jgi:hypothetical protein
MICDGQASCIFHDTDSPKLGTIIRFLSLFIVVSTDAFETVASVQKA